MAPSPRTPHRDDPWSKWFNRLVQVVGLGLLVSERFAKHPQSPLVLGALAMMLGTFGIRLMIRGARATLLEISEMEDDDDDGD